MQASGNHGPFKDQGTGGDAFGPSKASPIGIALAVAAVATMALGCFLAFVVRASARAELNDVRSALETERRTEAELPTELAAATRARDAAVTRLAEARRESELESKRLAAQATSRTREEEDAAKQRAARDAAKVVRTVLAMLAAGEASAASGNEDARVGFESALREASRMLNHQEANRGGALQPELDAQVGALLHKYGPIAGAAQHYERAVASGAGVLTSDQIADAAIGAAEVRMWIGERAQAATVLNSIAALDGQRLPRQLVAIARLRALIAASGTNQVRAIDAIRDWHRLARIHASADAAMLHTAALAFGNALRAYGDGAAAEQVVRDQLQLDETLADPCAVLESRALLAWILFERGHLAEAPELERRVLAAVEAMDPGLLGDCAPVVTEFLEARANAAGARRVLEARWQRTGTTQVSPIERMAIARALKQAYDAGGQAELAAAMKDAIEQLETAARPVGAPNAGN